MESLAPKLFLLLLFIIGVHGELLCESQSNWTSSCGNCLNSGVCLTGETLGYCTCPIGFRGSRCEIACEGGACAYSNITGLFYFVRQDGYRATLSFAPPYKPLQYDPQKLWSGWGDTKIHTLQAFKRNGEKFFWEFYRICGKTKVVELGVYSDGTPFTNRIGWINSVWDMERVVYLRDETVTLMLYNTTNGALWSLVRWDLNSTNFTQIVAPNKDWYSRAKAIEFFLWNGRPHAMLHRDTSICAFELLKPYAEDIIIPAQKIFCADDFTNVLFYSIFTFNGNWYIFVAMSNSTVTAQKITENGLVPVIIQNNWPDDFFVAKSFWNGSPHMVSLNDARNMIFGTVNNKLEQKPIAYTELEDQWEDTFESPDTWEFWFPLQIEPAPTNQTNQSSNNDDGGEASSNIGVILPAILVPFCVLALLALGGFAFFFLRKQSRMIQVEPGVGNIPRQPSSHFESFGIEYKDLVFDFLIGAGNFGEVWRGSWRSSPCAIKKMKLDKKVGHKELESFKHEAEIMAKLRPSVNVVLFLGVALPTDETPLCICVEYCEKGSLKDYLDSNGPLDELMLLKILLGVARGMYHITLEKIIHKDLAARNVFLTESFNVKVGDFGLAALKHTESQDNFGPVKWMSPEALKNANFSEKSDIWSFGVLAWECLTGKSPYGGLTTKEVSARVMEGALCLEVPENCPEFLSQIMKNCWQFDPAQRPTFKQIVDQLNSVHSPIELNVNESSSAVKLDPLPVDYADYDNMNPYSMTSI